MEKTAPKLEELIRSRLEDGKLPCEKAFEIARNLKVRPLRVGRKADEMGIKISRCQLGLFGYGPKSAGKHRIVQPASEIPVSLKSELEHSATEGKISCAQAWAIAKRLGIPKLEVANAAEGMGIRIVQCQLGCF